MERKKPQVLLLGNGINQAYGGGSWKTLIERISTNPHIPRGTTLSLPMPLQAILVTEDHIETALKDNAKTLIETVGDRNHMQMMQSILSMGFDHILTTNYSYELEQASLAGKRLNEAILKKMMRYTTATDRAEPKYLYRTYNLAEYGGHSNPIWHVHGELRKPTSLILGHYYYVKLLQRICDYLDKKGNSYQTDFAKGIMTSIESWADAYILGDVYVLGFGYDISEIDLWWLLNRKKREKAEHGKLYYFTPKERGKLDEKAELLRVLGAEIENLDMSVPGKKNSIETNMFYQRFYRRALDEIKYMMQS